MKECEQMLSFRLIHHWDGLLDPVYEQGYLADSEYHPPYPENPYPFPKQLDKKRMIVASKPGYLTEAERDELRQLNEEFAQTEWSRWSKGNYYRWCVEQA